jgi:peptide/nickel transport system substrate-binding protein
MRKTHLSWRKLVALAAAGVLAVGAVAASAFARSSHSRASSTLVDGTTDTVTNIDPAGNYDFGTFTVDAVIFNHLLELKPGGAIVPGLATKCSSNAALTAWTCMLKRGVKFQNGADFTSADVKWSFDRVQKIKDPSGIYTLLSNLKSTTVAGPYKVVFHLAAPQSTWPYILTTGAGFIVPKDVYPANKILPNTSAQVGTGPYQLVKYTPGQQAVFKAYEGSPVYKAKTPNLIINYYSKSSTMKLALQRSDLDMAFREFTPQEYASLGETSGITVYKGNGVVIRYLVLNVKRPPTNSLAVRKALAYLMPRQTIATRVYHGLVKPLYSMVPAGLPGHIDAFKALYGATPSVAKAKAVLQKAGVTTPVPITIWWTPTHYGDASADEYAEIQRALNGSGLFKVTLRSAEWATYSKTLGTQYGTFQLGWFPDYPDAEDYLLPFYGTKSNFTSNGYSSAQMDKILARERAARTTAARMAQVRQAQILAAKDVPIIPYWQGAMLAVAHKDVHGIPSTLDPTYIMRFWLLSKS